MRLTSLGAQAVFYGFLLNANLPAAQFPARPKCGIVAPWILSTCRRPSGCMPCARSTFSIPGNRLTKSAFVAVAAKSLPGGKSRCGKICGAASPGVSNAPPRFVQRSHSTGSCCIRRPLRKRRRIPCRRPRSIPRRPRKGWRELSPVARACSEFCAAFSRNARCAARFFSCAQKRSGARFPLEPHRRSPTFRPRRSSFYQWPARPRLTISRQGRRWQARRGTESGNPRSRFRWSGSALPRAD